MRKLLKVLVIVILIVGLNQAYNFWWRNPSQQAEVQEFTINEGESFATVAGHLKTQNIIANAGWFRVAAEISGITADLQVGTYQLDPGEDYTTILAVLTAGTTAGVDLRVTIPEGYTLKQIGKVLADKGLVTETDWEAATGVDSPLATHAFIVAAQKPASVDLEGYLFPDTYEFSADMDAETIATIMLENLATRTADFGQASGDAGGLTMHEVITLASIVEREVRQPETMKIVADIFLKRLALDMALQADSTVNYVTGGDDPSITLEERDTVDSPYNTYKYPGLPPGPIASPGLNALAAVMQPTHNNYYYFLTTDNGEIYYAETNDEHVRNKAIYLK